MRYFAQIDNDNIVIAVLAQETTPEGTNYVETFLQGKPRKNFAGVGYTYVPSKEAFVPPKPYASWLLNEDQCLYVAPKPHPNDGNLYTWDENQLSWSIV